MVPFADLLEYRGESQTTYRYDEKTTSVVIEAVSDIKTNERIYCSNEPINNATLFVRRGYVAADNMANDSICLTFALAENDP